MSVVMPMREQKRAPLPRHRRHAGRARRRLQPEQRRRYAAKLIAGVAVVALIWSIHRYGRLGPDAPIVFTSPEDEAAPKKKKKKKKKSGAETETSAPTPDEPHAS